jgi:tol-pal system protein YbgF
LRERLPEWRIGWMLGFLLAATGCATTQTPDLTQDVASLNMRVAQLQKKVEESLVSAHSPQAPGAHAKEEGVSGTDLAALDARIAALEAQIAALRQRLDDSAARVDSLSQDLQATRELALRMQPAHLAPTQPPQGDGEEATSEASTSGLEDRPDASATVEDTFSAAYADYAKGNFALALAGFQEFLKKYPTSELADNAQYWIADSYYAQGDFESAAAQFDEVVQKYPKGDRVPAALLKRALCLIELNRTPDGVVLLQHLIQTYPSSEEASLAKQKLEAMGVKP